MNPYIMHAFNDELEKIALILPTAIGALSAEDTGRGAAGGAIGGLAGALAGGIAGGAAAGIPAAVIARRDPVLAAALLQAGIGVGALGGELYGGYRGGIHYGGKRKKKSSGK